MNKLFQTFWRVALPVFAIAAAGPSWADGLAPAGKRSLKDAPAAADTGRQLSWSVNIGGTTDYVFRGISQSAENPAFQAGIDWTYGLLYWGAWGSGIDFGDNAPNQGIATAEIDLYAGMKPVWGPLTFDFGIIYYAYPGAKDGGPAKGHVFRELDYVELKAGVSGSPVDKLTLGGTVFYSPEYTSKQGEVWTLEGSLAYELPKLGSVTPTFSALIGYQVGDFSAARLAAGQGTFVTANGADDYVYWNAGLALAFDKLTLDFRYWDTDIANVGPVGAGFCKGTTFQCDERFVFSAKITLP
jgi:uncharacterized protein (TIGR02001 family)